jgi:hypothetical protein
MANHLKDLTGYAVGNIVVSDRLVNDERGRATWAVKCTKCDNTFARKSKDVTRIKRCCCKKTHGITGGPTYTSWQNMLSRCRTDSHPSTMQYKGRGITVCDRWLSFENFLSDMGERPDGKSIERVNNNGNYEPDNCCWATTHDQSRNRQQTHMITYNGKTQCLKDWANELGINYASLRWRVIRQGWPVEDAFNWKHGKFHKKRKPRP